MRGLPLGVASALLALGGCAAPAASPVVRPSLASSPEFSAKLCADKYLTTHGPACLRFVSAEEQAHREASYRYWYQGGLVVRAERINGRGFPSSDDDGCSEHRYRYQAGEIAESTGYRPDGTVCERSLYSEHASRVRFVDAWGRPDFRNNRRGTGMLYTHDADGFISSMRPLANDGTPTTLNGAAEVRYERDAQHFDRRVCYFDAQGKPTLSDSGVHCYEREVDDHGNDVKQRALGLQGEPVVDGYGTHALVRKFDAYGNMLEQTDLGVDLEPAHAFATGCVTLAFHYDERGFHRGTDCLDAAGKPSEFEQGNASWVSTPDARGRTREVRFFDRYGNPFTSATGYARLEMDYDDGGHVVEHRYFLADGTPGQREEGAAVVKHQYGPQSVEVRRSYFDGRGLAQSVRGCAAYDYQFDQYRDMVRQTCRDGAGHPAASRDKVVVTVWRYDAEGQLAETQFLDPNGKLADNRAGYARRLYSHDAAGADRKTRHFKADGSPVPLKRFAVLWVHPPYSDGFWPSPSRVAAVETIEEARRELLAGMSWPQALARYGDDKKLSALNPGDTGYLNPDTLYPVAREATQSLEVGEYSPVVEMPYGLALYLRTE